MKPQLKQDHGHAQHCVYTKLCTHTMALLCLLSTKKFLSDKFDRLVKSTFYETIKFQVEALLFEIKCWVKETRRDEMIGCEGVLVIPIPLFPGL